MVNIENVNLIKIHTSQMQQDETTQALCNAITPQINEVANDVSKCLILSRIEKLPEEILDELAYELHIEWYDANAKIDAKRRLIKNSDKVHMYLGTPYAVEQVIQDYFRDGNVEEWFNYGGQPFYFNVITSNPSVTEELAHQFTKAIETVKNKRSRLDQIIISLYSEFDMYLGAAIHTGDKYIVKQVV